jgi:aryl-alcohol dehydrogenase-like predicted oxidoreductase
MEYRQLGRSGLRVSCLSLGTMTFGGRGAFGVVGTTDVAEARRQVDQALDAGVNLIDTADIYSTGLAEDIVGQVIRARRDRLLLATKARFALGDGPNDAGLSRQHLIDACDASLRRLQVDHIDLYQVHEWDGQTPVEETLEALDQLVRSGKVRYIGCSNFAGWQLAKSVAASERRGLARYVSQQIHYSLQAREAEFELIPAGIDAGLGVLVWSPLAGGLLTGKYRRDAQPESDSRQLTDWGEPPVHDREKLFDIVDVLVEIGEARDCSAAQVALAWLLTRPSVSSVIIGVRTSEQLADNLDAAALTLSDDEVARLDAVSRLPLIYPHWHQAASTTDRLGAAELSLLRPYVDQQ